MKLRWSSTLSRPSSPTFSVASTCFTMPLPYPLSHISFHFLIINLWINFSHISIYSNLLRTKSIYWWCMLLYLFSNNKNKKNRIKRWQGSHDFSLKKKHRAFVMHTYTHTHTLTFAHKKIVENSMTYFFSLLVISV